MTSTSYTPNYDATYITKCMIINGYKAADLISLIC